MPTREELEEDYYTKFNIVLSYIFAQKTKGNLLPNFKQTREFEEAKYDTCTMHRLGLITEFYNRICAHTL